MYQIFYLLWGANQSYQRRKRRKTTVVCSQCEKEYPIGTQFCGGCGSSSLVPVPQFEKIEDSRFAERTTQLAAERTRAKAIDRIRALRDATACATCSRYFCPPSQFCTSCGVDIAHQLLSDESILPIVQSEFPQLIRSSEDYTELLHAKPPRGLMRRTVGACLDQFFRVARR